jgi:hypothetical protein
MNKCSLCSLEFGQYFLYTMHRELDHINTPNPVKPISYTKEQKAAIVQRCETRLGAWNFMGAH